MCFNRTTPECFGGHDRARTKYLRGRKWIVLGILVPGLGFFSAWKGHNAACKIAKRTDELREKVYMLQSSYDQVRYSNSARTENVA